MSLRCLQDPLGDLFLGSCLRHQGATPPMVSLRGQSESGTTTSGEVLQLPASEFASVDTTGVFRKHLQLCKYPLKK
jgi:hypothetical protein